VSAFELTRVQSLSIDYTSAARNPSDRGHTYVTERFITCSPAVVTVKAAEINGGPELLSLHVKLIPALARVA